MPYSESAKDYVKNVCHTSIFPLYTTAANAPSRALAADRYDGYSVLLHDYLLSTMDVYSWLCRFACELRTAKGPQIERLVQVCYDMSSPKTEKREVDSLIECAGELKCNNLVIVTNNDERTIEKDGYKIDLVPLFKF